MIDFSPDQREALLRVREWLHDPLELELTLGGLAGTGKTTLVREIMTWRSCSVVAFTGKAAFVLRTKGVIEAQTLHSLIYQPTTACKDCGYDVALCREIHENMIERRVQLTADGLSPQEIDVRVPLCPASGTKTRFLRAPAIPYSFVIVDEASMLNRRLVDDLRSYGSKILFVGDHGQLEPIGDDPGLMRDPQIRLEQIHRQAAENPIIPFAHTVRKGAYPRPGSSSTPGVVVRHGAPGDLADFDVVLCGYNKTRVAVNARIRERRGFSSLRPQPGERVICLRNAADYGIFNGMQATVTGIHEDGGDDEISVVDDLGTDYQGLPVMWEQFGAERTFDYDERRTQWDFGYAMTTHKSQGSEWKRVCVLEQIARNWSASRWRYTAATRAAEELTWCLPG